MPYTDSDTVKTWAQTTAAALGVAGYDEPSSYQHFIEAACHAIDQYCDVPDGFFEGGGVEVQQEKHDGLEAFSTSVRPFIRLNYAPVLSVTKFEEETSAGTWTPRMEGRNSDYIVVGDGVRFNSNVPDYDYDNIRVTYKAGYNVTPAIVADVAARLAGNIIQRVIDSRSRTKVSVSSISADTPTELVGVAAMVFTDELKSMLSGFMRRVPVRIV